MVRVWVTGQGRRVELVRVRVPVRPDALEYPGPVVVRVGQHADCRNAERDELAVEEGDRGIRGGAAPKRVEGEP